MNRIDVSYVYVHLTWTLWFFIYLIASLYGIYIIWTDLKSADRGDFVMVLLLSIWVAVAYTLWKVTS